ncbi:MAG: hypothetical protein LBG15_07850 [Dysgonamonadaceae bacterium]|jgi:hypothetical protein|nr:hypothetical protein [Dysgonamonadaceae bacterium]
MKTIKELTITVTYKVSYGEIMVSDDIAEELEALYDSGGHCDCNSDNGEAVEWLNDHTDEADAFDWEYEINELELEDEDILIKGIS